MATVRYPAMWRHFNLSAATIVPCSTDEMSRSSELSSQAPASSRGKILLAAALLIAAAFGTYWNSLHVPFIFDDGISILENPTINDLSNLAEVLGPPKNGSGVTGRPIVNLSLALNYAAGGTSVIGYHLANVFFHTCAGLLLFGWVRRTFLFSTAVAPFRGHATAIAFVVAALWLLHPLQTESVTCIIQRTELLVGVFYLATLYCLARMTESTSPIWKSLCVTSCFLGMATKEVMVTAPVVALLYDRTFIAGSFSRAWQLRRGIHLALCVSWVLLAVIVLNMGGSRGEVAGFGVGVSWWAYALKQCEAITLYLMRTVWPHPLVLFYGADVVTSVAQVWPQLLLLVALAIGALYAAWRHPALGFCGLWFFAILAPSSSVVPLISQTVAEHRMYLPLVGPLAAGVVALFALCRRPALLIAIVIALALGVISARRNVDYRSDLAIWNDNVAKVPRNARARVNFGAALKTAGLPARALEQYVEATRLDPASVEAWNNVGTIFLETGRPADAIEPCRMALRLKSDYALAHNNVGTALAQTGKVTEGIEHLRTAIRLKPAFAEAHCNLASALVIAGDAAQAIFHGEEAVRINPAMALAYFNLSNAFLLAKQPDRAKAALESAVRVSPDYAEAQSNLGTLHYLAGDAARAIPHLEAALRSKPDYLEARNNLASALSQAGRGAEAVEQYKIAIRQQPGYAEAYANLGLVLARLGRNAEALAAYSEALRLRPDDERARNEIARLKALPPGATTR